MLTQPRADDVLGRTISAALMVLIATNVTANVLETDAEIAAAAPGFFHSFEIISVAVFSLELVLRVWSCVEDPRYAGPFGRLRFLVSPMALVDIAAIAPFYFTRLVSAGIDLRYLRVFRLLRILKLLRSRRIGDSFGTLVRVVQSKRAELGVTLAMVCAAMLLSAGAMYLAEHEQPGTAFTSIPKTMWWAIVTITTIGYGDMVPSTTGGQIIGGFVGFLGICALALPVGILSSGFIEELNRKVSVEPHRCPNCGHEHVVGG